MDTIAEAMEVMIASYNDEEDLMNFAATWGIQESILVNFRLFQIRNPIYDDHFVNEQLDSLLDVLGGPVSIDPPSRLNNTLDMAESDASQEQKMEMACDIDEALDLAVTYVKQQEDIEECTKAYLFDEEMTDLVDACLQDGDFQPPSPIIQRGDGDEQMSSTSKTTLRDDSGRHNSTNNQHPGTSNTDSGRQNVTDDQQPGAFNRNTGRHGFFDDQQPSTSNTDPGRHTFFDDQQPSTSNTNSGPHHSCDEQESSTSKPVQTPPSDDSGRTSPVDANPFGRLKYSIKKKSRRIYSTNAAVDQAYLVKIDERHYGQQLSDIRRGLHEMFDHVLNDARGQLAGNDLGRVIIHHTGLSDPIVIPLTRWDILNAHLIMQMIEMVLNSHEELSIDQSFEIIVGAVTLPKGGAKCRINRLKGANNTIQMKRSLIMIHNNDNLCMARAIGLSWAHLKRCTPEEWKEIAKDRQGKSNLQLVLEKQKVPENYYKNLYHKNRKEQQQLAETLSQKAGVSLDRYANTGDLKAFEEVLGVRVMVVNARLGNKFVTSGSSDQRPCIYLYLENNNHFHAITSITGFFCSSYFCEKCLVHYNNKENHQCDNRCIVCKTDKCLLTDNTITCQECNMVCRSQDCMTRHKEQPVGLSRQKDDDQRKAVSECEKWWKCTTCYKVIDRTRRKTKDHRCGEYICSTCQCYVLDGHVCYLRATPYKLKKSKFIFFDFEATQDETFQCQEGYSPNKKSSCTQCQEGYCPNKTSPCTHCTVNQPCKPCTKCRHCATTACGKMIHRPNYAIAHTACDKCKELPTDTPCKECGDKCVNCKETQEAKDEGEAVPKLPCLPGCGQREFVFKGDDTLDDFGKWLFTAHHKFFTVIAHNMKGYDGYFLLEYLIDQSIHPSKIIYAGSKIMYMQVDRGLNITVMDSLNFLPMKLASLPETFGLTEMKKGNFPHFFNTRENQNFIGNYPDPEFYGSEYMSGEERDNLLEWLVSKEEAIFDFKKEMLEYCRSDVDILRRACLTFRDLMMSATRTTALMKVKKQGKFVMEMTEVAVDPFHYSTIASVCMGIYTSKFLKEEWEVKLGNNTEWTQARFIDGNLEVLEDDTWIKEGDLHKDTVIKQRRFVKSPIAKVPSVRKDQYSKSSIQWLEWMAVQDDVYIQHALNGGERMVDGGRHYRLDGYSAETNTAYEFNGCVFHGCIECYPNQDTVHTLTHQSMRELYAVTQKKKAYIERQGMKYKCIWEHEFQQLCRDNQDFQDFIQTLDIAERLDARDSFFGGRTNASRLYYTVQEHEQIKYVDFTSLYPWVNKYCEYPVGHPEVIQTGFKDIDEYFGIAKIKIAPPRGLYHPVLPHRSNGKLKFPLCGTCADAEQQNPCECTEEERTITGTWCTPEINTAVRLGYKVIKIFEVYHWVETTKYDPSTREGGLFSKYINTFLRFKQEASGPPEWIKTEEDVNKYIGDYFEREGVSLRNVKIEKNPGLRALAKLCLNSFWGKFGQRPNLKQTEFFHESEVNKFFQRFTDPMKQPQNFHIVADDILQLEWKYKTDCLPEDNKTNIYVASFTTCWARLKLYSELEQLDKRVLYYDTDSIIYVSRPGQYDPPLGDYLGELTDELKKGQFIVEFVSGGPKNYGYRTNTNKETCKVRGFTLNFSNSKLINFEAVKALVTDPTNNPEKITITNPKKICRDQRKRKLYTSAEEKKYRMVYTKRRRTDNFDTEPYGF